MRPCLSHNVETKPDNKIESCTQNIKIQEQNNNSVNELLSGDLYVVGRIWIGALQKALTGASVPVVHAAKLPELEPKRPPKMKYTDLPVYETPHYDYKDFVEDKDKCPERNDKILQQFLLPYIKKYRKIVKDNLCHIKCTVNETFSNTSAAIYKAKNDFKATMRDSNNLTQRQAVVGLGTLAGYLIGGGGGLPRRVFFTSAGFLTTGALCFPKETDEIFRTVSYTFGQTVMALYNFTCKKDSGLRERVACKEDLTPPPQK